MAKYKRYSGDFVSRNNVKWTVNVLQEADNEFQTVGELIFAVDNACVIEWAEKSKEEVICGSSCTLQVISPSDRTYVDMYTETVGAIRCDVYRNGNLYWCGTLDPEFYEEPYERASDYIVSLTFSDLGVLERLKYTASGSRTVASIVQEALTRCGLIYTQFNTSFITTSLEADGDTTNLADLYVSSENFYDEDGEPMTLDEVMNGVLQPLGLRITQRMGTVYVYDLNGLATLAGTSKIKWSGDSQTLGVDKVYNNIKLTFSPYVKSGNIAAEECWTMGDTVGDTAAMAALYTPQTTDDGATVTSYNATYNWADDTAVGFCLLTSTDGEGAVIKSDTANFYKIVPKEDGQESDGIMARWWHGYYGSEIENMTQEEIEKLLKSYSASDIADFAEKTFQIKNDGTLPTFGYYTATTVPDDEIFRTDEVSIPKANNPDSLRLRVGLNLLLDVRLNPYESVPTSSDDDVYNEAAYTDKWKQFGNFVYIPVKIILAPDDGGEYVYIWDNRSVVAADYSTSPARSLTATLGEWKKVSTGEVDSTAVHGYFCWYDPDDRVDSCGVMGWNYNRPAINPHKKTLIRALSTVDDGQIIPYPDVQGTIAVRIYGSTWIVRGEKTNITSEPASNQKKLPTYLRWVAFQLPEIEIQNNSQWDSEISTDDVVYSATINEQAKEDLSITTTCGTYTEDIPTARGAYFDGDLNRISQFTRAGRTTQVEELLIGTLFSQYAERHNTLSGECDIPVGGLQAYTEPNQDNRLFILSSSVEDVAKDTTEALFIELSPDDYNKTNLDDE